MIVHVCNPSYSGGRGRRILVPGQPRQKHETLSEKQTKARKAGVMARAIEHLPSNLVPKKCSLNNILPGQEVIRSQVCEESRTFAIHFQTFGEGKEQKPFL
jgi:hypothetical protein